MLLFHGILTCFMLAVMWFDATRYIIPNWLVGVLVALYPAMVWMAPVPVDWLSGLLVGLAAFGVGFALFSFRWMGGGDVKLLAACCLWTGKSATLDFIIYTAIIGGILSIVIWGLRPLITWAGSKMSTPPTLPRVLMVGEPMPYGLAISSAFLLVLWLGKLPGLPVG